MMKLYALILLTLWNSAHGHLELLNNINSVIISKFEGSLRENDFERYFKGVIDAIVEANSDAPQHDAIAEFEAPCGAPVNRSACYTALDSRCADIPQLLTHFMEHNAEEINLTDLLPLVILFESLDDCEPTTAVASHTHSRTKASTAQAWGYGIGFVALICFISNVGGCMAPFMSKRYFQRMLMFCVALAVGTLAGTGMLVLIPESMHLTGDDSPIPDYHFKMATVLGGVYFFYVSERFMKMYFGRDKKKKKIEGEIEVEQTTEDEAVQLNSVESHGHSHFQNHTDDKANIEETTEDTQGTKKKRVATVAWIILVGDALHNFVDGIAIGAAFTENIYLGISVSLAVVCEELPHELGDVAVLLHSGMSMKRALCYNFWAATTCFIGLVIGILVGENSNANVWIFAAAGGMFVYIALVDMLPEMSSQFEHVVSNKIETPLTCFCIQNLGLIAGFVIIFVLVLYGGNIEV